jgi:hypothetical protein
MGAPPSLAICDALLLALCRAAALYDSAHVRRMAGGLFEAWHGEMVAGILTARGAAAPESGGESERYAQSLPLWRMAFLEPSVDAVVRSLCRCPLDLLAGWVVPGMAAWASDACRRGELTLLRAAERLQLFSCILPGMCVPVVRWLCLERRACAGERVGRAGASSAADALLAQPGGAVATRFLATILASRQPDAAGLEAIDEPAWLPWLEDASPGHAASRMAQLSRAVRRSASFGVADAELNALMAQVGRAVGPRRLCEILLNEALRMRDPVQVYNAGRLLRARACALRRRGLMARRGCGGAPGAVDICGFVVVSNTAGALAAASFVKHAVVPDRRELPQFGPSTLALDRCSSWMEEAARLLASIARERGSDVNAGVTRAK